MSDKNKFILEKTIFSLLIICGLIYILAPSSYRAKAAALSYGSVYKFQPYNTKDISVGWIDDSRFVVAYHAFKENDRGVAKIGTVTGKSISYSDPYYFSPPTDDLGNVGATHLSVLDSNHIVVAYEQPYDEVHVVVGTISGDDISFGNPVSLSPGEQDSFSVSALDSNHFALSYVYRDSNYDRWGRVRIGTTSGNSVSLGSAYDFNPGNEVTSVFVEALSSSKFVIAYADSTNDYYNPYKSTARIGLVSGTSISFGDEYVFDSRGWWFKPYRMSTLSSSKFVITYTEENNTPAPGVAIIGEVSGTSISFGSREQFASSSKDLSPSAINSSVFSIVYGRFDEDYNSYGESKIGEVSGTSISFGPSTEFGYEPNDINSASTASKTVNVYGEDYQDGSSVIGEMSSCFSLASSCSSDGDCCSGYCTDGVCCDSTCGGTCEACDLSGSVGTCTYISSGQDPDGECTGCQTCNGSGSCVDDDSQCTDSGWDGCSGSCVKTKSNSGVCNSGSCGTDSANISSGYVCAGAGNETAVSSSYYCNYDENCDAGDCSATEWWTSCDGSGSCRSADDHTDSYSETVYAEAGYSITDSCGTTGSTLCNDTWADCSCEGDDCYDDGGSLYNCQGMCDGNGNCDHAVNCVTADSCQSHDTWGWAWSGNVGWISFSCKNRDHHVDYGVDMEDPEINDSPYALDGYAWSENVGWVSFASSDLLGCPSGACEATVNDNGRLSGWARALSGVGSPGGWEGWISLEDLEFTNYQVWIDSEPNPSEFRNWGWGGDPEGDPKKSVIGWTSFNCAETGLCSSSDYKVYTNFNFEGDKPEARNLGHQYPDDYCGNWSIYLSWEFYSSQGSSQSAYQVQIDDVGSSFASPSYDTGWRNSSSNEYAASGLDYETTYDWRIRVKDQEGRESDWAYGDSFTTDSRWPAPDFSFSPEPPVVGELTEFTDQSDCWYGGSRYDCSDDNNRYEWGFGDGAGCDSNNDPECRGDVTHTYEAAGDYTAILCVTDSNGTCCVDKDLSPRLNLPEWDEVRPGSD